MGKARMVEQIKNDQVIQIHHSVNEAARLVGVSKQAIQRACDPKQKWRFKPAGFLWRYHYDSIDGEIWKNHPNHPVKVSTMGRIKLPTGVVTYGFTSPKGYKGVEIQGVHYVVSRLICETFLDNPENKPTVDHINRVRDDNRLENLRWATYVEQNNNRKDNKVTYQ